MRIGPVQIFGLLLILFLGCANLCGQEAKMARRTFQLPSDLLTLGSSAGKSPDPFNSSETSTWQFASLKTLLLEQGIEFPPGAAAFFDPRSGTAVIRNTAQNLGLVEAFIDSFRITTPVNISTTACIIQAPGELFRQLKATRPSAEDQTETLQHLLTEAEKPGSAVKVLHRIHTTGKGGATCLLDSVTDREYMKDPVRNPKGFTTSQMDMQRLGLSLKLDPGVGADGQSFELRLAIELNTPVKAEASGMPTKNRTDVQKTAFKADLIMNSGDTRLAGLWSASADPSDKPDVCQALFVSSHLERLETLAVASSPSLVMPQDLTTQLTHTFDLPTAMLESGNASPQGLAQMLARNGIRLPEGCQTSLDEEGRMVVKTTPEALTEVDQWVQEMMIRQAPATVAITTEIIRAPARLFQDLPPKSVFRSDYTKQLKELHDAISKGKAHSLHLAFQEVRAGEKTTLQSHLDMSLLSEVTRHEHPQPNLFFESHLSGLALEFAPEVVGDRKTVSLDYRLSHQPQPAREQSGPASETSSIPGFSLPRHEFELTEQRGQVSIPDGVPHLIGSWPAKDADGEMLDAVFITARVVRHPGLANQKLIKTSANRPPVEDPAEFITESFVLPPAFWMTEDEDAFDVSPEKKSQAAMELLRSAGIPLPEGSKVIYFDVNSRLTVKTIQESMEMVDAYIGGGCGLGSNPERSMLTLHVFQTDRMTAVDLLAQMRGRNDHTSGLQSLLSKKAPHTRSLVTLSTSTLSGREIKMQNTQDSPVLREVMTAEDGAVESEYEERAIGTIFEGTLSSSANRLTSTLDYSIVHHPSAPVLRMVSIGQSPNDVTKVKLTDVPEEKAQGSIVLMPGTARILGAWKPVGPKELEAQDIFHIAILETAVMPGE